jgi:soluble lytic murein transglycosylase-like protein
MTNAIRLRRAIAATLFLTATLTILPASTGAAAPIDSDGSRLMTTTSTTTRLCPIDWRRGRAYVKDLIRCAARHYGINVDKALYVADRESNFHPDAYNSWSCAKGLYQHLCRYWPERAETYGYEGRSAFNGRANIMVTMRMVKRNGWSPWGG